MAATAATPANKEPKKKTKPTKAVAVAPQTSPEGQAEARLIEIYRLIGRADTQTALTKAERLVKDHPTFALAQLVYGDLLSARARPVRAFGDVPSEQSKRSNEVLGDLRDESVLRLNALRERPPAGTLPAEFLQLSSLSQHAIAIDASRSRLYLFENKPGGMVLLADYYISVGKLGVEKKVEGDQRTPLGVYFITSLLDPKNLKDFYGSGALPINYPNVLDLKRGKTGGGIWLHGTPPGQFARAPQASDGCVVLSNPDLVSIIRKVKIRSTPVVIAKKLKWVTPRLLEKKANDFENHLQAWLKAKSSGKFDQFQGFYAKDFSNNDKSLIDWLPTLQRDMAAANGRNLSLKDVSLLHWVDSSETMVVTFGEVATGQRSGLTRRQYWSRHGNEWKIFYEGVIG